MAAGAATEAHPSRRFAFGSVDTIGSRVECARSQSWTRPSPATEAKTVAHVGDHATSFTTSQRSTDRRVWSGAVCRSSHKRTVQSALLRVNGGGMRQGIIGRRSRGKGQHNQAAGSSLLATWARGEAGAKERERGGGRRWQEGG